MITKFSGKYNFLSNFHPVTVYFEGVTYPSVEHAYQAAKTTDPAIREVVCNAALARDAKRLAQKIALRPDWEDVKLAVMHQLVQYKFKNNAMLRQLLLDTGNEKLVEGNTWGDVFWGECPLGVGHNHLGKILMRVRKQLKEGAL